jgi:hypothetical protein
MLERVADADAAHEALSEVLSPSWRQEPITQASALRMLSVLVGTLTKRKADDEHMATKPAACADLFNPATRAVGDATGLWSSVSDHPAILALAVKRLIFTSIFEPTPSELHEAMKLAHGKIASLAGWTERWLAALDRSDHVVFLFDREGWEEAHARMNIRVVLALATMATGDRGLLSKQSGMPSMRPHCGPRARLASQRARFRR